MLLYFAVRFQKLQWYSDKSVANVWIPDPLFMSTQLLSRGTIYQDCQTNISLQALFALEIYITFDEMEEDLSVHFLDCLNPFIPTLEL